MSECKRCGKSGLMLVYGCAADPRYYRVAECPHPEQHGKPGTMHSCPVGIDCGWCHALPASYHHAGCPEAIERKQGE